MFLFNPMTKFPIFPQIKTKHCKTDLRIFLAFLYKMDPEAQLMNNLENQLKRLTSELEDLEETK